MIFSRREMIGSAAAVLLLQGGCKSMEYTPDNAELYGLIGQIRSVPGSREELLTYLLEASQNMPGNLAYLVAKDANDGESIWITEVWTNAATHQASLSLPHVQAAITKARPLIAGFGTRAEVIPAGGRH